MPMTFHSKLHLNQLSRKTDWYCTKTSNNKINAATPHGELPSDGIWYMVRLLSQGDPYHHPGLSTVDSHRTAKSKTSGAAISSHPMFSSVASTTDSYEIYHCRPRNMKITAKNSRTGYGKGFNEKTSKIEEAVLLLYAIFWWWRNDWFFFFFLSSEQIQGAVENNLW